MKTLTFRSLSLALVLIAVAPYSGGQTVPGYDALIAQGNALLQTGNADQALKFGEAATKARADRWEGYSLAGGALLNLKRYEDAADALSKAIDRAPESKQPALRAQRRECLLAESGYPPSTNTSLAANTSAPRFPKLIYSSPRLVSRRLLVEPEPRQVLIDEMGRRDLEALQVGPIRHDPVPP